MKKYLIIILLIPFLNVVADVPMTLSHQGRLYDADGEIVPDGEYTITVNIYDSIEPDAVAVSTYSQAVFVSNGIFNIQFGGDDLPGFDGQYFVGISVDGGEELGPKIPLNSVPTSIHSSTSDHSKMADRATIADDISKQLIPVGTIFIFAGISENIPEGWMKCDGTALNSTEFEKLHNVLGKAWGDGSDDETEETDFNLPDLRGMFLRGVDEGAGNDPDANFRQSSAPGGNTGDFVGTTQSHSTVKGGGDDFEISGSFETVESIDDTFLSKKIVTPPGTETRPINASVYYIIKVQ